MPKRKRSAEEKIEYYKNKIRKYESKQGPDEQNANSPTGYSPYVDSYGPESPVVDIDADPGLDDDSVCSEESEETCATEPAVEQATTVQPPLPEITTEAPTAGPSQPVASDTPSEEPALDPELLEALGEVTAGAPEFGEKIHENLAQLWSPLLKKGLSKEAKEKITKDYLVPENCKLLQAPKLNAEITAAISELSRNRDKKIASSQQQLGVGITAINRAMTILLSSDDKKKAIKCLSDGCRILCDLHYLQTHYRTKLITPSLDKSFCQVIQDDERDETLFGTKLSERIKASKAITKQGSQIKKPVSTPKPSSSQPTAGRPATGSGNWTGPRSSNRGGRGGSWRGSHAPRNAPRPRASPAPAQTPLPSTSRPRAPTHQRR